MDVKPNVCMLPWIIFIASLETINFAARGPHGAACAWRTETVDLCHQVDGFLQLGCAGQPPNHKFCRINGALELLPLFLPSGLNPYRIISVLFNSFTRTNPAT